MAKVDLFENVTYRDTETGKFITNWMTSLKKKKKINIGQFYYIFSKCSNINYPVELKMMVPGYFKMFDDKNNLMYLKCHPYEDVDIDSYSIIIGSDEFFYRLNQKGEVSLKGIMEVEIDKIVEPVKEVAPEPVVVSAPVVEEENVEEKIDDLLKNKLSSNLPNYDYELLNKWLQTAIKSSSFDEFSKKI